MQQLKLSLILLSFICLLSCSKDDNKTESETVNIEYKAILSKSTYISITTIINNETQFFNGIFDSIFSEVYVNKSVNKGTFLRMAYDGESNAQNWEDYSVELIIYVDGEIVSNETFLITLDNVSGTKYIDYTF